MQMTRTLHSWPLQFATAELGGGGLAGVLGEPLSPHPDAVANTSATTVVAIGKGRIPTVWRLLADEDPIWQLIARDSARGARGHRCLNPFAAVFGVPGGE